MIERLCAHVYCRKPIGGRPESALYCGARCKIIAKRCRRAGYYRARQSRKRAERRAALPPKKCTVCGEPIIGAVRQRKTHKHCGGWRPQQPERAATCPHCGKAFTTRKSWQICCSKACGQKRNKKQKQARRSERYRSDKEFRAKIAASMAKRRLRDPEGHRTRRIKERIRRTAREREIAAKAAAYDAMMARVQQQQEN